MIEKKNRKQVILDTALACFNELGVEATTIDMIRARSGASVGSLYHHFGNKDSIGIVIHECALDLQQDHVQKLLVDGGGAEATVKAIVWGHVDFIVSAPALARFLMQSRGFMVRTADDAVEESGLRDRMNGCFRTWLGPFIRDGTIRQLPSDVYMPLIIGPIQEYAWNWLAGRSKTDIGQYAHPFAEAAWSVVRAGQAGSASGV